MLARELQSWQERKMFQSVNYYCMIVYLLPMCDRPTHYPGGLPLFVYFSLDTGFLSSNGKPSSRSSSIGDKIGTDLKQELRATVNIGAVLTIVTMLH